MIWDVIIISVSEKKNNKSPCANNETAKRNLTKLYKTFFFAMPALLVLKYIQTNKLKNKTKTQNQNQKQKNYV